MRYREVHTLYIQSHLPFGTPGGDQVKVMLKGFAIINRMYSAKIFIEDETADGKSLIYKMKSRGPKMEPCGTPDRTGDHSE